MTRRHRHTKSSLRGENSKKSLYSLVFLLIFLICISILVHLFRSTLFFTKQDRINLVFYGKHTTYYSLGIKTAGDYAISFPPDLKMPVPGGYGDYRVGALGKLVSLENKPQIIQNTFSLATFSFDNFYFYTPSDEVYYGSDDQLNLPSIKTIWSSTSNAHLLDKLYLIFYFMNKKPQDFHNISVLSTTNKLGEEEFLADDFENKISGYLFQQSYRNEQKTVQIMYADNYINADRIGKILEGNGIKVGDISQDGSLIKGCIVRENKGPESATARAIVDMFHCRWEQGTTDIYDILFQLGDRERDWSIK